MLRSKYLPEKPQERLVCTKMNLKEASVGMMNWIELA